MTKERSIVGIVAAIVAVLALVIAVIAIIVAKTDNSNQEVQSLQLEIEKLREMLNKSLDFQVSTLELSGELICAMIQCYTILFIEYILVIMHAQMFPPDNIYYMI